jgi:hypothetical protein
METFTTPFPPMKPEEISEFLKQIDELMRHPIPLYTANIGSRSLFTR